MLADKDARGIVAALAPVVSGIVVTQPESPRARPAAALAAIVEEVTGTRPLRPTRHRRGARRDAAAHVHGGLLITGSLTTAGQARRLLRDAVLTEARRDVLSARVLLLESRMCAVGSAPVI